MKKTIAQQLNIKSFPFNIKDEKGNEIYYEDSSGYWEKSQFDEKGNRVYLENSNGYWEKSQFDEKGNIVYLENSNGNIVDNRPKQTVEITLDEIAKKFNIDISQVRIKD
jgi:hypothetical protein